MGIFTISDKHTLRFKMLPFFSASSAAVLRALCRLRFCLEPATVSVFRGPHATARLLPSLPRMCHNRLWKQCHE